MKRPRAEQVIQQDKSFDELGLEERVVTALKRTGKYEHPTPVQSAAVPLFLEGHDMLIRSETGSGKTLAYLLPVLNGLVKRAERLSRADGTYAVIIAPTRELVVQIVDDIQALVRHGMHWIIPGYLIGGEKKKAEKARLRKGVTVLVATPGRLLDHLRTTEAFKLKALQYLVFDEADRLLDMGFEHDIRAITQELKNKSRADAVPQTALISATLFDRVMTLASLALHNPKTVNVDKGDSGAADKRAAQGDEPAAVYTGQYDATQQFEVPASLEQHYMVVPCKQRLVTMLSFLAWQLRSAGRTIVFCSSCAGVDFLYQMATTQLAPYKSIYRLHGRMGQLDRVKSFSAFRNKDASVGAVLLCSDAAARGLDFPRITWIVQYDAPPEPKEYIHRVGRTARMGNEGKALLFLMPAELEYVELLRGHGVSVSEVAMEKIPPPPTPISSKDLQALVEKTRDTTQLAQTAFASYVRSYAAHPQGTKHIFHPKALHLGHVAQSFALSAPPNAFRSRASSAGKPNNKGGKAGAAEQTSYAAGASSSSSSATKSFPMNRNKNAAQKTLSNPYAKAMRNEFDAGF